jgi:hypothetical protein
MPQDVDKPSHCERDNPTPVFRWRPGLLDRIARVISGYFDISEGFAFDIAVEIKGIIEEDDSLADRTQGH